jgi:hypothetical protein
MSVHSRTLILWRINVGLMMPGVIFIDVSNRISVTKDQDVDIPNILLISILKGDEYGLKYGA